MNQIPPDERARIDKYSFEAIRESQTALDLLINTGQFSLTKLLADDEDFTGLRNILTRSGLTISEEAASALFEGMMIKRFQERLKSAFRILKSKNIDVLTILEEDDADFSQIRVLLSKEAQFEISQDLDIDFRKLMIEFKAQAHQARFGYSREDVARGL